LTSQDAIDFLLSLSIVWSFDDERLPVGATRVSTPSGIPAGGWTVAVVVEDTAQVRAPR